MTAGRFAVASLAVVAAAAAVRSRRAPRWQWTPSSGTVIEGHPLPARVLGAGKPTVVLLHGMFNSNQYWGGAYDDLAGVGRTVAPDLLGFGRGPRPTDGYDADAHADAVAETIVRLGADGPAVVAAHSIGTLVSLRLAVRSPQLVGSIVGFAPPIHRDQERARRHLASMDPLARLLITNEDLAERACAVMCRHRSTAAALVRVARPRLPATLAHDRVEHSWASYSQTLANLVLSADAQHWLDDIRVPVHLVAGTDDDALDHDFLHELADRHRHVTITVITGGHDVPLSQPTRCTEIIEQAIYGEHSRAPARS